MIHVDYDLSGILRLFVSARVSEHEFNYIFRWHLVLKQYDCTIIVTAYEVGGTIEACLRSIFRQDVGARKVLVLVGYAYSGDGTFNKLIELGRECPNWAEYRVIVNARDKRFGFRALIEQAIFLNCYRKAKGGAVLFCGGRNSWINKTKLVRQLNLMLDQGIASYTQPSIAGMPDPYNPVVHGNTIVFSSLCMPAGLGLCDFENRTVLLDWYIVCRCYQNHGLRYLNLNASVRFTYKTRFLSTSSLMPRLKNAISTSLFMKKKGMLKKSSSFALIRNIIKFDVLFSVELMRVAGKKLKVKLKELVMGVN